MYSVLKGSISKDRLGAELPVLWNGFVVAIFARREDAAELAAMLLRDESVDAVRIKTIEEHYRVNRDATVSANVESTDQEPTGEDGAG